MQHLQANFSVRDLGKFHYFLGVEVSRLSDGLLLSQQKYINDILRRTNMLAAKPVTSPLASNSRQTNCSPFSDPTLYRQTVGALQYLQLTRPDIAFAVRYVCQFMQSPTVQDWTNVKRILRYLLQTASYGLKITKSLTTQLHAFSDADWASCSHDRKSVGGFAIYMGPNLISWAFRKQKIVSRSSTESEYKAVADATAELIWLRSLLQELRVPSATLPILWCDNVGATYLSVNPVFHARTKHIEIDFHFVHDEVANKRLIVRFISTKDQIADIMTKALTGSRFQFLRDKLRLSSLKSLACGGVLTKSS